MNLVQQLHPTLDRPYFVIAAAPLSQPPLTHGAVVARLHENEWLPPKAAAAQPLIPRGPVGVQHAQPRRPFPPRSRLRVIGGAERDRRATREAQQRLRPWILAARCLVDEETAAQIDTAQAQQTADSAHLPQVVLENVNRTWSALA